MKQFVVKKGDRKFIVFAEDKISAISKLKDNVLSNTSEIIRKCSEFIKNFQGSDKSLYVEFETREKKPSNIYVNGKQQDMTIKVELSYEPDDQGGLFFIDCYGYLDGNKMTKIISRTAESKKAMNALGEVSNKLHQTIKDGGLETLEEEYNYVGKTHDELIQSGSEEALQKNIATEIKAGKDPKQAAAIAYSVQRENDDLFNVYDIEYLNAKSVVEHWKTYANNEEEAIKNFESKFARMGLSKTSILNIVQTNKIEDSTDEDYTNSTYTNGNYTLKILNKVKPGEYGVNNAYNVEWNGNKQKLSAEGISMVIRHNKMHKISDSAIKDSEYAILHPTRYEFLSVGGRSWVKEGSTMIQKFNSEKEAIEFANKNTSLNCRIVKFEDSNTITDADIPHITKEQWNKIPKDYKHIDPKTGKKMAFAGSLGIAPGGTTLLTEGMHFIIDSEEKNYTYIMFGTTGEKRVDNLTKAEAEHLLKNNKLLGYDGKVVETKELGDDITTQQYFTDISDKFDLSKYTNDPETVETQSGGTSIIELSEDDEYNVKLVEALKNAGYRKVASYKFVKDTDCNIKDAYYNIGGYKSETDNMLKQDISKARSYGLRTYVEKVDGSYQLTVEGSRDKVEKIVEDYFAGDVSSIGDKQVFSEETMNSVQRGIEKDYENMNKDLEELHDTSAPKEIEDLPLKARQEMKNAKEKGSKLLEILSQLQDIVNKASAEEKAEVKYKAEKILADLKKQFGLEKETYIKLDSAIKDGTTYGITPLFKWKKGNKKPERVEYSLESARYVKNSLERNDRIPYVIFELDTYRIVDSIQDDDKEKIKLKNELETLKSELKSNNRKYWKISEINEKEDRIVELERRIAELES